MGAVYEATPSVSSSLRVRHRRHHPAPYIGTVIGDKNAATLRLVRRLARNVLSWIECGPSVCRVKGTEKAMIDNKTVRWS